MIVVPGKVVHDEVLINDIVGICQQFEVQEFAYDPGAYASQLVWALEYDHGLPMRTIKQNPAELTEPIDGFETWILGTKIRHRGNHCMDWMVRNVQMKSLPSDLKRIVKPGHVKDVRRIDGVAAAIMGMAFILRSDENQCAYDLPEDERVVFI